MGKPHMPGRPTVERPSLPSPQTTHPAGLLPPGEPPGQERLAQKACLILLGAEGPGTGADEKGRSRRGDTYPVLPAQQDNKAPEETRRLFVY